MLRSVAFSPDDRMLASGSDDGTIILWDIQHHEQKEATRNLSNAVWTVAFSPDGQTLASGNAQGQILRWNVPELRQIGLPLTGHKGGVNRVAFRPGSQTTLLVSGGEDFTIRLWDHPIIAEWEGQACRMANRILTEAEGTSLDEETRHTLCPPASLDESPIRNTETKPPSDPVPPASSVSEWFQYRNLCKMEVPS